MIDLWIMLSGAGSGDDCAVAHEGASLRVRDTRRITGIRRGSLECFRIRFCVVERHDCGLSLVGHGHRLNPRHRLEARLNSAAQNMFCTVNVTVLSPASATEEPIKPTANVVEIKYCIICLLRWL